MKEYQTKMDVERECEEVRRIFADAGNGQTDVIGCLRDLEESETTSMTVFGERTIYCIEDIVKKAKEKTKLIREGLRALSNFKTEREYDMMREKRLYETVIERLSGHEKGSFEFDSMNGVVNIGLELISRFGETVVKGDDGEVLQIGHDRNLTVGYGLVNLIEDMYIKGRADKGTLCIKDIIKRAKEKVVLMDEYSKTRAASDAERRVVLEQKLRAYESVIKKLTI